MMNIENIDVRENENTHGYCCDFCIGNKKFYADVSNVMGAECMIFAYDKDNKFIDWSGVYVNTNVDVSKETRSQEVDV